PQSRLPGPSKRPCPMDPPPVRPRLPSPSRCPSPADPPPVRPRLHNGRSLLLPRKSSPTLSREAPTDRRGPRCKEERNVPQEALPQRPLSLRQRQEVQALLLGQGRRG